jgi:6-pyruvoyltetrahydropterin/6-carboxytetrahydropterin synthase
MFEIKVKATFSSAHNLRNYRGKCEHLHGHNWNVEAVFAYKSLDSDGMAIDFREAKSMLKDSIEDLDHSYLNDLSSFKKVNPTSENIAKFIRALDQSPFGRMRTLARHIRKAARNEAQGRGTALRRS